MAKELDADSFKSHISGGLALVDFWAPWCGPCQMLGPVIEELSHELKDVKIGKLNVDEFGDLAGQYQVSGIPTMILFKKGEMVDRRTGVSPKTEIKKWIEGHK
ncbi:MAG: thioredoxin [Candidatus Micrarchaeota archaeon]